MAKLAKCPPFVRGQVYFDQAPLSAPQIQYNIPIYIVGERERKGEEEGDSASYL
jgi:hypothetical protein